MLCHLCQSEHPEVPVLPLWSQVGHELVQLNLCVNCIRQVHNLTQPQKMILAGVLLWLPHPDSLNLYAAQCNRDIGRKQ